jgi:hypothetical protein
LLQSFILLKWRWTFLQWSWFFSRWSWNFIFVLFFSLQANFVMEVIVSILKFQLQNLGLLFYDEVKLSTGYSLLSKALFRSNLTL